MSTGRMRVGVVGCGDVTSLYLPYIREFPVLDLVACADLDTARAEAFAAEAGIAALSTDALLADPSIEAVLNLTPPQAHARVTRAAIAAGKHVYSEKPLATNREDARAILSEAAAKNVRIGGAPDTFLGGSYQTARALIDEGAIGTPIGANAAFLAMGPEFWHPNPGIFYGIGGGPMLDMGPYYVTALVSLLGPVAAVSAVARGAHGTRRIHEGPRAGETFPVEVPTHTMGAYTFANGAIGQVMVSFDVAGTKSPNLEIHGTAGSLHLADPNNFDGPIQIIRAGEEEWTDVPLRYDDTVGRSIGLADMATAIRSGRPHRASGELAYHVLDVMLATEEAAAAGRRLDIESTCERPPALPLGLAHGTLDS